MNNNFPKVTLLIVVRNESGYIEKSLQSLLDQTYPKELTEIIIVDGMSTDGTKEFLKKKVEKVREVGLSVKFLDNPKKILAAGWNLALEHSSGEMVCRIDGHSVISDDYVAVGVSELLERTEEKIAAVGGWLTHLGQGMIGQSIACLLSSRFGVGNSPFRQQPKKPTYTDTVVYAVYWKRVFEKLGSFDERMERSQDIVFHKKMREHDYAFITHPKMKIKYYVRSTFEKFVKKAFMDGVWAVLPGKLYLRHVIPLFFASYTFLLIGLYGLSIFNQSISNFFLLFSFPMMCYLLMCFFFALKDGHGYSLILFFLFPVLHLTYGIGSMWGVLILIMRNVSMKMRYLL